MQKYFFFFGILNLALGVILGVFIAMNFHLFGSLENADRTKIEAIFLPLAPIMLGIAFIGISLRNRK